MARLARQLSWAGQGHVVGLPSLGLPAPVFLPPYPRPRHGALPTCPVTWMLCRLPVSGCVRASLRAPPPRPSGLLPPPLGPTALQWLRRSSQCHLLPRLFVLLDLLWGAFRFIANFMLIL